MTRQEIEKEISPMFSDGIDIDIDEIDIHRPLFGQHEIDELDILDLFYSIDDEFGTDLYKNDDIDLYIMTLEDLYNWIEQEVNR